MELNIIEGNKLFAKFMELEYLDDFNYPRDNKVGWYDTNGTYLGLELLYHSSYEWLMLVVEKIETTTIKIPDKYKRGFLKNSETSNFSVDMLYDDREEFKGWTADISFICGSDIVNTRYFDESNRMSSKKECLWFVVFEFIKWYNENKLG